MSSSPRNAYLVMIAGAIAVLTLVAWALVRSLNAPVHAQMPVVPDAAAPLPPHQQVAEHAAVPRISPEELRQKMTRGEVIVIDVRDADAFFASHIPGALHIPLSTVEGAVSYLPKDKPIVAYCT
jgi:3-mercaptopyruvate sulfurtransferase SseA